MNCTFCDKLLKNKIALAAHLRCCSLNPTAKGSPFKKSWETAWNKGLTKETSEIVRSMSAKAQITNAANPSFLNKNHTDETRKRMSDSRNALYASGWEPVCGRAKKYDYISPVAGQIKVDGTWELRVCHHLDSLGVKWNRNRERFKYVRPDGKNATYQPDFFVEDWNCFIEVKGYETELDHAKWSQFPHKLEVWKRDKIGDMAEWPIAQVC